MSLRRSSRMHSEVTSEKNLPDGSIAKKAAPSKKRGRNSKASEDLATEAVAEDGGLPQAEIDSQNMPPPSTPANKRRRTARDAATTPVPFTPTPSAIGLMTSASNLNADYSTGGINNAEPPPTRPVQVHRTNATLVTPGGTQYEPSYSTFEDTSPSKPPAAAPTTNNSLLEDACTHMISIDPKLKAVIDQHHCKVFSPEGLAEKIDPFRSLTTGIIAQQVSGAAAKSIKNKFVALFPLESCPTGFPPPSIVAATDLATLRTAGLSQRKAEYIQGLAQKFHSGELTVPMLMNGSDEEVMEKLVAVRGLGAWSVQMFMCFGLKRMDIFSTGDLGVQRGMAAYVGRDVSKLKAKGGGKWKYMSEKDMLEISAKFSPYRSLFMWYMWRIEDVDVSAVQDNAE